MTTTIKHLLAEMLVSASEDRDEPSAGQGPPAPRDLAWPTGGRLCRAGDPVEGRDPDLQTDSWDVGGVDVSDHLGPAGDPAEGAELP